MKHERILKQLTDHIVFLPPEEETDRPIIAAIRGTERTLVVDAGNSPAHAALFLSLLTERQWPQPYAAVLTHWHWDHIFGSHRMGIPLIAHEATKQAIEQLVPLSWTDDALDERVRNGTEIPFCADMIKKELGPNRDVAIEVPAMTFQDSLELDLGGLHCSIEHVGGDHAHDSSIIYVQEERVLLLGDCLYQDLYSNPVQYTVPGTRALLARIQKYEADIYVLSHELPLSKAEFQQFAGQLQLLCDLTEQHDGNKDAVTASITQLLGRVPEEFEQTAVEWFANGYRK
ncbi:MBL fold metallo-hydrolase [Paenibacillus apiarius]|uniref:MBL fold metallo-hydrolase n=1 Tax=Paenibacillus apiarius TaxID=46240 RepID=UPI0019811E02|nr:MBL fold metallo-hydrolase [Paenibacillus apiarius]MBN3525268.1 MBL fold metallo-hydrolase [Paenibacillus apiarius]